MRLLLKSQEDRSLSSIPFSRANSAVPEILLKNQFGKNYSIVLTHMEKYLCLKRHGKASGLEDRIGNLKTRLAISFVSFFSRLFLRRLPHTSSLGLPDPGSAPAQLFDTRMCCQWTASSLSPLGERWPGRTEQRQVETAALPSRIRQAWSIGLWKLFLCSGKWIWSSEIH